MFGLGEGGAQSDQAERQRLFQPTAQRMTINDTTIPNNQQCIRGSAPCPTPAAALQPPALHGGCRWCAQTHHRLCPAVIDRWGCGAVGGQHRIGGGTVLLWG